MEIMWYLLPFMIAFSLFVSGVIGIWLVAYVVKSIIDDYRRYKKCKLKS